ncbi:MAG: hypothetical protein KGL11_05670 [Alphaproteobacteria bacterium]|nr:hypothetical protein [Alphaproteobacteria bacterium]
MYSGGMVRGQPSPIYTITPLKDGRYAVKASLASSVFVQYREFPSKREADDWIDRHQRELGLKPTVKPH